MMDLLQIRKELDKIDKELLKLLLVRRTFEKKVGEYKKKYNLPIRNRQREKEIIQEKIVLAKKRLRDEYVQKFFQLIIDESSREQKTIIGK